MIRLLGNNPQLFLYQNIHNYNKKESEKNQMLTINKTYNISANDDRSATAISLNKKNGFYNFSVTTFHGQKLEFQLNDVLAGELFTALKDLGNFK